MPTALSKIIALVSVAIIATTLCAVQAQPRRPNAMSPADILRVANVSEAQLSPNGQWVVYSVSTIEDNETISTLWIVRVDNLTNSTTIVAPVPVTV